MGSRWATLIVDAIDPARLGRWWAEVLDYRIDRDTPDEVVVTSTDAGHPELVFVRVSELKQGKNRLHIDLRPDDPDAEVERLVNMGARHVDMGQAPDGARVMLADPEGNEFCVSRSPGKSSSHERR